MTINHPQFIIQVVDLREKIDNTLRTVFDPEIPVNILDLGLIYEMSITENGEAISLTMTLTAPACPVADSLVKEVEDKLKSLPGVKKVTVKLTFNPPWNKDMMTEEAKLELGLL